MSCSLHWPKNQYLAISKVYIHIALAHKHMQREKFMWRFGLVDGWSSIFLVGPSNSGKRKQKADKVNEQRSHINRTFKLINTRECILWYLCVYVRCERCLGFSYCFFIRFTFRHFHSLPLYCLPCSQTK